MLSFLRSKVTLTRPLMAKRSLTAACCIIGDEILNGKTRDSNSHYLAKYLFNLGVDLKRVEIIPDDYDAIGEAIPRLSRQHDLVFTSGGIGPTHDDITYEAIAKAFQLPVQVDQETCDIMTAVMTQRSPDWKLTSARKRMAIFPYPAKILRTSPGELWVPVVVVNENVHILPGIPRLFERLLENLTPHFIDLLVAKDSEGRYYRREIATAQSEGDIAASLTAIQSRVASEQVKIGSYPKWGKNPEGVRVVVSIVGKNESAVQAAADEIAKSVQGWVYER